MKLLLQSIGVFLILFGTVLFFFPKLVENWNRGGKRVVVTDIYAIKYHRALGIIMLLLSFILFRYYLNLY